MASKAAIWRAGAKSELRGGWRTLIGATVGVAAGAAALPFYTAGMFVTPLQTDFGWTRSQLSLATLAATLTIVLCAPLAGLAVDRFGVRVPASFSLAALALGFCALGSMTGSFEQYLVIQVAMFAFAVASTPISFTRSVNERFTVARGVALGITLSGTGISAAIAPIAVAATIATDGWRTAYFQLAAVAACAIPVILLLCGSPRRVSDTATASTSPGHDRTGPDTATLFRTPPFLRLLIAFFFLALGVSGFVLHLVPILQDSGMSMSDAAKIQASLGISVIAGRLITGFLVDHFFAPRVAAISLCFTIAGIVALAVFGPVAAPWSAVAIGFALGSEVDLIGYLAVRYFGLKAYGKIYGVLYGAFVLGAGSSALLVAKLHDVSGGYATPLWTCASLVAVTAFLFATAPAFEKDGASVYG